MSTYAARRRQTSRILWWLVWPSALAIGLIILFVLVIIPWAKRQDARDALHLQQRLTALHALGFTKVTGNDFYDSSYYNEPTAFMYPVGTCRMEIVIAGSASDSRSYIWLKSVEDSKLFVTYHQLEHIPQTRACFTH